MIYPGVIREKAGRPAVPRSQSLLLKWYNMLSELLSAYLVEGGGLLERLDEFDFGRAVAVLRLFQWIGALDVVQKGSPYIYGINAFSLRPLPLLETFSERLGSVPKTVLPCTILALSYILPTPFRRVLKASVKSGSMEELSVHVGRSPDSVSRMIAQAFKSRSSRNSDLYLLLLTGYASGYIRPGKKSDPGSRIAYPRKQCRGAWRDHPCRQIDLCRQPGYERIENFVQGLSPLDPKIDGILSDLMASFKKSLPKLDIFYRDYYDLKIVSIRSLTA